jgi:hypothetical protein
MEPAEDEWKGNRDREQTSPEDQEVGQAAQPAARPDSGRCRRWPAKCRALDFAGVARRSRGERPPASHATSRAPWAAARATSHSDTSARKSRRVSRRYRRRAPHRSARGFSIRQRWRRRPSPRPRRPRVRPGSIRSKLVSAGHRSSCLGVASPRSYTQRGRSNGARPEGASRERNGKRARITSSPRNRRDGSSPRRPRHDRGPRGVPCRRRRSGFGTDRFRD